jgi:hypothetical protein
MTDPRSPLAQLQAQVDELVTLRAFWERWGSEWRVASALLNRAIERNDPQFSEVALRNYQSTLASYRIELKDLEK